MHALWKDFFGYTEVEMKMLRSKMTTKQRYITDFFNEQTSVLKFRVANFSERKSPNPDMKNTRNSPDLSFLPFGLNLKRNVYAYMLYLSSKD